MKHRRIFLMIGLTCGAWCTVSACAGFFGFEELVADRAEGGAAGSSGTGEAAGSSGEGGATGNGGEGGATGNGGEGGAAGNAGSSGAPMPAECKSVGVPSRPTANAGMSGSAGAGGDAESYAVAVSEVDFGFTTTPEDVEKSIGLNLDEQLTDTRGQTSCVNDKALGVFDYHMKDKANGIDNSGLALLRTVALSYPDLSPEKVNERLKEGGFGLVARVKHYNGASDDTDVFVTVQPAWGVYREPEETPPKFKVPNFNETDVWATDAEYYADSKDEIYPTIHSQFAYVSGGRLVARFDQLYANIGMPNPQGGRSRPFEVRLEGAWFVGDLSIVDGQMSIHNGILAGRWRRTEVFLSMRKNAVGTDQYSQCLERWDTMPLFRSTVCNAQDLGDGGGCITPASGEVEQKPPCNAISVGIGFTAKPASPDTFTTKPIKQIVRADADKLCCKPNCDDGCDNE